jgi:hypothetical protein
MSYFIAPNDPNSPADVDEESGFETRCVFRLSAGIRQGKTLPGRSCAVDRSGIYFGSSWAKADLISRA